MHQLRIVFGNRPIRQAVGQEQDKSWQKSKALLGLSGAGAGFMFKEVLTAKPSRTKSLALHVPYTSCAFAAVDDDTSNPEIAAMYHNITASVLRAFCADETRLIAVVDLCRRCRQSLTVIT